MKVLPKRKILPNLPNVINSLNYISVYFSHVFDTIEQNSIEIWKYEMYFLVMEYDKKTSFVPPFSIFSHIFLFVRWLVYKVCRKKKGESK